MIYLNTHIATMKGQSDAVREAADRLSDIERSRNRAMESSRIIIRRTKKVIHAIHVSEDCSAEYEGMQKDVSSLIDCLKDEPSVFHSAVVQDALGEYAEAVIFSAVVENKEIPSSDDLGITPQAWIMGFADSIGEIRRMILACLMADDLPRAKELFDHMETMGDELLELDVPDAVVPIRRKQDVARSIIEKTRSDIANAVMLAQYNKR